VAGALVERMAARLLVFFARHAALLRPLGAAGKLQLAQARPSGLTPVARCLVAHAVHSWHLKAGEASVLCAASARLLPPCWGEARS